MLNTITMTLICIFAVYGAVNFFGSLGVGLLKGGKCGKIKAYTVLFLRDNGDCIEPYIRSLIWKKGLLGQMEDVDIIAVDMGSDDDTMEILRRLEGDYDNLYALNKREYENFIKGY